MERFWNILHYFVYKADYRRHLLFNKINPILFFYRLSFAKKHFAKKGINPVTELNKSYRRPDIGLSSIWAGGFMYINVFLICFGVVNLYSGIIQEELNLKLYHFVVLIVISFVVNYLLLFKHDKYLSYFKEFEKMKRADKKRWAWMSLG